MSKKAFWLSEREALKLTIFTIGSSVFCLHSYILIYGSRYFVGIKSWDFSFWTSRGICSKEMNLLEAELCRKRGEVNSKVFLLWFVALMFYFKDYTLIYPLNIMRLATDHSLTVLITHQTSKSEKINLFSTFLLTSSELILWINPKLG
jgi:hypothetical protein